MGCRASGIAGIDLDCHDGGADGIEVFTALCALYGRPWLGTRA